MRTLNLGILAHVDAGKTSLTERLLFAAGVLKRLGSVDDGNTHTDGLDLEKQRGITIKAAVVSFRLGDVTVNLVDTPGHPDFIAEVERTLSILDAAIVVVSSVEGVQAQTRVLVRALRREGVPFLIFINKVDRMGADCDRVVSEIRTQLMLEPICMTEVEQSGTRSTRVASLDYENEEFQTTLRNVLSEKDDAILEAFLTSPETLTAGRLKLELSRQVRLGIVQPVLFGSAATGVGIPPLMNAIEELLPAEESISTGEIAGRIFKIDRGWGGEKISYVSLRAGAIHARQVIAFADSSARVTGIKVYRDGGVSPDQVLRAGEIGQISGLSEARIGDTIGLETVGADRLSFAPPTLETRIVARKPSDRPALWIGLNQLAEQDPLINLRKSDDGEHLFVSLYGEVQKEVIQFTLLSEFGIDAEFEESTVICVERLAGGGSALELIFKESNPFLATVGVRVEPRMHGAGVTFDLEVDLGQMPTSFYKAIEETVVETLKQGMFGWEVIDCHVALTAVQQSAPSTTAADFRQLTPLVLAAAIAQAGTVVCEPINTFRLDAPAGALSSVLAALAKSGAITSSSSVVEGLAHLEGTIAAANVHTIQQLLPGLTSGVGVMECSFGGYAPVNGVVPRRHRIGGDPFNRHEYLHRSKRNLNATGT